jgi:site-specific recombinase XerD
MRGLGMVTFIELYEDYYNQRISAQVTEGTLRIYEYTAKRFCEWADDNGFQPDTIERRQVREYIAILTLSGRAKATVDLHGRNIRALLRYGHLEGICPVVNFRGLLPKPPVRKRFVARKEHIEALLTQSSSLRDRAIILLMFESGVRRQETSNLNWSHLDFSLEDVLRIHVRSGKGDKDRVTFAGERTIDALINYGNTVPHEMDDPVFVSLFDRRLGTQGIDHVYKRLSDLAGIKVTPHAVRRGFAVEHRKMSVWDLQRLLGHSSVETTRLYVETEEDDLLDSYRAHQLV